jgi:DNA replication and repair protein RecF
MYLTALTLSHFRSHTHFVLTNLSPGFIGLTGPNGAGKTNVLEAISLLTPGRGLRHAEISELQQQCHPGNAEGVIRDLLPAHDWMKVPGRAPLGLARDDTVGPWSIHARVHGAYGPQDIGVGLDPMTNRRINHINGAKAKSTADLADIINCIWLTPREDRIFMDGSSTRRKMIDRWVFSADPAHAGRLTRLERLLSERNRLLSMPRPDPLWLDALEDDLAPTAMAVSTARVDYLDRLRTILDTTPRDDFPHAHVTWTGYLEDQIGTAPSLQIEQNYRATLKECRGRDAAVGATTHGPHRADLTVIYAAKNMPAAQCSTGEQKALLFTLFLAHARLVQHQTGDAPLILLDEGAAHLDPTRRGLLFNHLTDLQAQVFLTATTDDQVSDAPNVRIEHIVSTGSIQRKQAI